MSSISSKKGTKEFDITYYYDTSSRLVFVRFLEETEDTKKPFRNYLTFNPTQKKESSIITDYSPHFACFKTLYVLKAVVIFSRCVISGFRENRFVGYLLFSLTAKVFLNYGSFYFCFLRRPKGQLISKANFLVLI